MVWVWALAGCSNHARPPLMELIVPLMAPTPSQVARDAFNVHDPDLRRRSVLTLCASDFGGEPPYLRLYRLLLDDPDPTVRAACIHAIGTHGSAQDTQLLQQHLLDEDPLVRWEAAKALGKFHTPPAVTTLLKTLTDDHNPDVRLAAAEALGQYAQMRVYHGLVGALDDRSFGVVHAAQQSLYTLTGYDFGSDASLWMLWAKKQGDKVFQHQQPYAWKPYQPPATFMGKLIFWNPPQPPQPQAPKKTTPQTQEGA